MDSLNSKPLNELSGLLTQSQNAAAVKVDPFEAIFIPAGSVVRETVDTVGITLRLCGVARDGVDKENMKNAKRLIGEAEKGDHDKTAAL